LTITKPHTDLFLEPYFVRKNAYGHGLYFWTCLGMGFKTVLI